MNGLRLAFVTARDWSSLAADDLLAVRELERRGARVRPAVWNDPMVAWAAFDAVVLRSCWDYYHSPDAFRAWLDSLERDGVRVINPAVTVRWNMDKRYLADLDAAGVRVVPTEYPQRGARLHDIIERRGWQRIVLKPRVSAEGHRTQRIMPHEADAHQYELDALIAGPGALLQEYVSIIESAGEVSFIFVGGHYSHAVLKTAATGEFRVQERYGGRARALVPPQELIDQSRAAMATVTHPWSYARVDACVVDDRLLVMELELIEPSLFLDHHPDAPSLFADALLASAAPAAGIR